MGALWVRIIRLVLGNRFDFGGSFSHSVRRTMLSPGSLGRAYPVHLKAVLYSGGYYAGGDNESFPGFVARAWG